MKYNDYLIGIVISPCGINDHQLAEVNAKLAFIHRHLEPGEGIGIRILGFGQREPEKKVPKNILNLTYRAGVHSVHCTPVWDSKWGLQGVIRSLLICDEVWVIPGPGQATTASRTRVAQIYRAGVAHPKHSMMFKLIPTWIPAQISKDRKPKKGSRK